jgi:hypothetical protein
MLITYVYKIDTRLYQLWPNLHKDEVLFYLAPYKTVFILYL